MHFSQPESFWLLIIPLFLLAPVIFSLRIFQNFLKSPLVKNFLFKSSLPDLKRRFAGIILFLLSLSAVICGLAKPYYLAPVSEKTYHNIRIFFCLDVSLSMSYAEDIKPNRLTAAKKEIADFYKSLDGVYEVGLIPFAGEANVFYCPLSFSKDGFLVMLEEVGEDSVISQGTDLVNALDGLNFIVKKEDKKNWSDGINLAIVLSDGGQEEGFAIDQIKLQENIKSLKDKNFGIYTIGIGKTEPTPLIQRDWAGNFVKFLADAKTKKIYHSQLDEAILRKIAELGNGQYFLFDKEGCLKDGLGKIILANRVLKEEHIKYQEKSLAHWFFALAVVLLYSGSLMNKKLTERSIR